MTPDRKRYIHVPVRSCPNTAGWIVQIDLLLQRGHIDKTDAAILLRTNRTDEEYDG